jgi:hypothetical protein
MSVEDPNVIDFVAHDPKGEVVLVMVEGTNGTGAANACSSFRKRSITTLRSQLTASSFDSIRILPASR